MVKCIKAILRVALLALAIAATSIIAQAQGPKLAKQRPPLLSAIDTTAPKVIQGLPFISEITPPPFFEKWWSDLATCEAIKFPDTHRKTRYFVANTTDLRLKGDTATFYGVSSVEDNGVIILALEAVLAKGVVTHEQGHLLLDWAGIDVGPYHIAEFFDRCGLKPWGG